LTDTYFNYGIITQWDVSYKDSISCVVKYVRNINKSAHFSFICYWYNYIWIKI